MRPLVLHVDTPDLDPGLAARVCEALASAMDTLGVAAESEVALVLTSDEALRDLNARYRAIDAPTDVLSFPFPSGDQPPGEPPFLGDIVISVPFASRGAEREGRTLESELRLLAVHGLLHLLGHEDVTEAGAEAMRHIEVRLGVREAST